MHKSGFLMETLRRSSTGCFLIILSVSSWGYGQNVHQTSDTSILSATVNALSAIKNGDVLYQHDDFFDSVEESINRGNLTEGVLLDRRRSNRLLFDLENQAFARFSVTIASATDFSSNEDFQAKTSPKKQKLVSWQAIVVDVKARNAILFEGDRRTILREMTEKQVQDVWNRGGFEDFRLLWRYGDQFGNNQWPWFERDIKTLCGRLDGKKSNSGRTSTLSFSSPYTGVIHGMGEKIQIVEEFEFDLESLMPLEHEVRFEGGGMSGSFRSVTTKWSPVGGIYVPKVVNSRSRQAVDFNGVEITAPLVSNWRFHWIAVNGKHPSDDEGKTEALEIGDFFANPNQIDRDFIFKLVDPVRNGLKSLK